MSAPSSGEEPSDRRPRSIILLAFAVELGLGAVALLVGWALGVNPLAGTAGPAVALPPGLAAALGVIAALPPLGAVYLMSRSPRRVFRELMRVSRSFVEDFLGPIGLPVIVLLSLAAGFGEELLFRGLLQGRLAVSIGVMPAILATSILFALLHAVTKAYAVYALLLSVYLGVLYATTGNILSPMLTHAVYDALVLYRLSR